jgi:hypothetical protein
MVSSSKDGARLLISTDVGKLTFNSDDTDVQVGWAYQSSWNNRSKFSTGTRMVLLARVKCKDACEFPRHRSVRVGTFTDEIHDT